MNQLPKSRASRVFLLLVAATLFSWHIGHTRLFQDRRDLGALIVVIAFIKVRWVMLDFMELRHGPRYIRVTAEVWLIGVCTLLVTLLFQSDVRSMLLSEPPAAFAIRCLADNRDLLRWSHVVRGRDRRTLPAHVALAFPLSPAW